MITTTAKWQKHSEYKKVPIRKRQPGTGTSGGQWLAASTTCHSLSQAKSVIDGIDASGSLSLYQSNPTQTQP